MIYIIKYENETEVTNGSKYDAVLSQCKQLRIPYVVNRTNVSKELVVLK